MNRRLFAVALAAACTCVGLAARAEWPEKPVKIIVPFAAGGGTDIMGRLIAERLSAILKQPFVVENKAGAGATLGADLVAKSPPDGYTLLMGTSAEMTIGPNMIQTAKYNPAKDFYPVAHVGTSPNVILAHPSFPPKDVKELIAYARANPDKVSYGSGGSGTGPHLSGELLKSMGKFPMMHIPYKGSGPAITDLLAGQTQLMIITIAPALPLIQAGKARAVAVTSAKRAAAMPDVPTVAEAGLSGYEAVTWYALLAPAGIPRDIAEKLHGAVQGILTDPEVLKRMNVLGIEPGDGKLFGAAMQERISTELARWGQLVREVGVKAD